MPTFFAWIILYFCKLFYQSDYFKLQNQKFHFPIELKLGEIKLKELKNATILFQLSIENQELKKQKIIQKTT